MKVKNSKKLHSGEQDEFPETQYADVHENDEEIEARIREVNQQRRREAEVAESDPVTLENWNRHPMRARRRQGVYSPRGSGIFQPGCRIAPDSLLTVIAAASKNAFGDHTWAQILCRCDCGKEVIISYAAAIQGKFSCGCQRRQRKAPDKKTSAVQPADFAGATVTHSNGRSFTLLWRKSKEIRTVGYMEWEYCCGLCAATFTTSVQAGPMEWPRLADILWWRAETGCPNCPECQQTAN